MTDRDVHVLVVEDEPSFAEALTVGLRREGFRVTVATDGLSALERACNVRDYYSGFYIARHEDGQLCARRDLLQSRSGASCKAAQLSRLVVVRD